jgi:hypothetical protein
MKSSGAQQLCFVHIHSHDKVVAKFNTTLRRESSDAMLLARRLRCCYNCVGYGGSEVGGGDGAAAFAFSMFSVPIRLEMKYIVMESN